MLKRVRLGKTNIRHSLDSRKVESLWCYAVLFLPLVGLLLFTLYPILWTFRWAFYSYNGIPSETRFIGIENFQTMFTTDLSYWKAWGNTLLFAVMKMPIELLLALFLAMMLTEKTKGAGIFRAMFYLPNVISFVIIGVIFSNMFRFNGVVNDILTKAGIISETIDWGSKKMTSMWMLVIASIWNTFGINVLYFISALSNVPKELYEAAEIDGASARHKFLSVTLPSIAKISKIIILFSLMGTLQANDIVLTLTGGGPYRSTHTVLSYMTSTFMPGFAASTNPPIGYGCALSMVTSIIFVVVAIGYNKLTKKFSE